MSASKSLESSTLASSMLSKAMREASCLDCFLVSNRVAKRKLERTAKAARARKASAIRLSSMEKPLA